MRVRCARHGLLQRYPQPLSAALRHLGGAALWAAVVCPLSAQMPVDFAAVELARSRTCVGVMAGVQALDARLAPLAGRSQRLLAIGQAIALEEREAMDSLRIEDPVEAAVHAWFVEDAALAERYVAAPDPALLEARASAKDSIESVLQSEFEALRARADSVMATTGSLGRDAGNCSGAVFILPAVLEACATTESPVCEAARDTTSIARQFRFVESAEVLWGIHELRAWSQPGPIQVLANGQLGGARTVGLTRAANIVVTLAFGPRLRRRADLTGAELGRSMALADSLGFGGDHPVVVYPPSLAVQATLPTALGGETRYVLHFGPPEQADILWVAEAGTGAPIEGVVELGPARLARLQASEQLMLTALRQTETGTNEPVYSLELTSLNQGPASSALLAYMSSRLGSDLAQLIPAEPTGPAGPTPSR